MPHRRTTNRQTEQGSTSTDMLNVAATPMETLLKQFQSFKPPTLAGTENAIECENWLDDIEQLIEALEYTDDRRSRDLKSVDGLLYLLVNQSKEQCDAVLNNVAKSVVGLLERPAAGFLSMKN
ncbi:hypothetical protein F511_21345 [Dorcoceras hygrometricum]|uniref:Uncharacterized protein n=1 Tax=Dorcoceras hygrometricum TaxID=472368 RepID=A0A2Z7CB73_9LAMI|nr:hypothetical protein F511_21345 [Dorcoceras hygrometricum]